MHYDTHHHSSLKSKEADCASSQVTLIAILGILKTVDKVFSGQESLKQILSPTCQSIQSNAWSPIPVLPWLECLAISLGSDSRCSSALVEKGIILKEIEKMDAFTVWGQIRGRELLSLSLYCSQSGHNLEKRKIKARKYIYIVHRWSFFWEIKTYLWCQDVVVAHLFPQCGVSLGES